MSDTTPAPSAPGPIAPSPANPSPVSPPKGGRVLLLAAAVLFVGWLCWLGYTALNRSPAPFVSHAQAAGASTPVVAELTDGNDGHAVLWLRPLRQEFIDVKEKAGKPAVKVTVVESWKSGPVKGQEIGVTNFAECVGYTVPGTYLLLLNTDADARADNLPAFTLAGVRQPGTNAPEPGTLRVYPWNEKTSPGLRAQVEKLFP